VHLYVNRVFIMDECDALMPRYLRFVKGVVDAHDLSLNVSRELLQHDRHIRGVRRRLVKKVLGHPRTCRRDTGEVPRLLERSSAAPSRRACSRTPTTRKLLLDLLLLDSTHDAESRPRCASTSSG
jgi:molecular chaperone HtpG